MHSHDDIIDFIKNITGSEEVNIDSDIYEDLNVVGDDFHELIEKWSIKYQVDMSKYHWYFHADEEGGWTSIGGIFFKPPYHRVRRIPITPRILTDFVNNAKWDLNYPVHTIPIKRFDILINKVLMGILIIFLLSVLIRKYLF